MQRSFFVIKLLFILLVVLFCSSISYGRNDLPVYDCNELAGLDYYFTKEIKECGPGSVIGVYEHNAALEDIIKCKQSGYSKGLPVPTISAKYLCKETYDKSKSSDASSDKSSDTSDPATGNYGAVALGLCDNDRCYMLLAHHYPTKSKLISTLSVGILSGVNFNGSSGAHCLMIDRFCPLTSSCWAVAIARVKKKNEPLKQLLQFGYGVTEDLAIKAASRSLRSTLNDLKTLGINEGSWGMRWIRSGCPCEGLSPAIEDISVSIVDAETRTIGKKCEQIFSDDDNDPLTFTKRAEILGSAASFEAKELSDGKGYGYRLGGDGSDGYIDCSHAVHQIYRDAGLNYEYINVAGIRTSDHFREVVSKKAKIGDLIVFLPFEGNDVDPSSHVGVVANVDENGRVVQFVNAAARGGDARNRISSDFRPAQIHYDPTKFQTKASINANAVTWRIYRWQN